MNKKAIAIISLIDKFKKESIKSGESYYLLTYKLQKALTNKYFALIGEKKETLQSNKKPLFLFNDKKKFAYHLTEGKVYFVEYTSYENKKNKYFHVKDWRILGDKLSVERSWNLLQENKKHE